ncbi:MAG: hypothetical protein ACTS46_00815 [Candidatus Hodgkinia cicadicola]
MCVKRAGVTFEPIALRLHVCAAKLSKPPRITTNHVPRHGSSPSSRESTGSIAQLTS